MGETDYSSIERFRQIKDQIRGSKEYLTTTPKRGGIKGDPKRVTFTPRV